MSIKRGGATINCALTAEDLGEHDSLQEAVLFLRDCWNEELVAPQAFVIRGKDGEVLATLFRPLDNPEVCLTQFASGEAEAHFCTYIVGEDGWYERTVVCKAIRCRTCLALEPRKGDQLGRRVCSLRESGGYKMTIPLIVLCVSLVLFLASGGEQPPIPSYGMLCRCGRLLESNKRAELWNYYGWYYHAVLHRDGSVSVVLLD